MHNQPISTYRYAFIQTHVKIYTAVHTHSLSPLILKHTNVYTKSFVFFSNRQWDVHLFIYTPAYIHAHTHTHKINYLPSTTRMSSKMLGTFCLKMKLPTMPMAVIKTIGFRNTPFATCSTPLTRLGSSCGLLPEPLPSLSGHVPLPPADPLLCLWLTCEQRRSGEWSTPAEPFVASPCSCLFASIWCASFLRCISMRIKPKGLRIHKEIGAMR